MGQTVCDALRNAMGSKSKTVGDNALKANSTEDGSIKRTGSSNQLDSSTQNGGNASCSSPSRSSFPLAPISLPQPITAMGVGVDVEPVSTFRKASLSLLRRNFTKSELTFCRG